MHSLRWTPSNFTPKITGSSWASSGISSLSCSSSVCRPGALKFASYSRFPHRSTLIRVPPFCSPRHMAGIQCQKRDGNSGPRKWRLSIAALAWVCCVVYVQRGAKCRSSSLKFTDTLHLLRASISGCKRILSEWTLAKSGVPYNR